MFRAASTWYIEIPRVFSSLKVWLMTFKHRFIQWLGTDWLTAKSPHNKHHYQCWHRGIIFGWFSQTLYHGFVWICAIVENVGCSDHGTVPMIGKRKRHTWEACGCNVNVKDYLRSRSYILNDWPYICKHDAIMPTSQYKLIQFFLQNSDLVSPFSFISFVPW